MRVTALAIAIALATTTEAHAIDPNSVWGSGPKLCSEWTESERPEDNPEIANWVIGYFSGLSTHWPNNRNIAAFTDRGIINMTFEDCKLLPNMSIANAVILVMSNYVEIK
jgi:hypothetical protein